MLKLRSVTAGALATAMLATSVAPAMAQGYPGSGYGRPGYNSYGYRDDRYRDYRRHRKNDDTGAIVAGVIGVGILAAIIASASSKSKKQSQAYSGSGANIRTDDAAADGCAVAAEQQLGGSARVNAITAVDRVSDGYNVRGTVDYGGNAGQANNSARNDSWRGQSSDERSFACSVRYGAVQRVDFGGYASNY